MSQTRKIGLDKAVDIITLIHTQHWGKNLALKDVTKNLLVSRCNPHILRCNGE